MVGSAAGLGLSPRTAHHRKVKMASRTRFLSQLSSLLGAFKGQNSRSTWVTCAGLSPREEGQVVVALETHSPVQHLTRWGPGWAGICSPGLTYQEWVTQKLSDEAPG